MASVLIIDDNRSKSTVLKRSLTGQRHRVRRSQDIWEAIYPRGGAAPDLVLINQAMANSTGWELFYHLKQLAPDLPAMVYVLDNDCVNAAGWICRAVDAACEVTDASQVPPGASLAGIDSPAVDRIANENSRLQWRR